MFCYSVSLCCMSVKKWKKSANNDRKNDVYCSLTLTFSFRFRRHHQHYGNVFWKYVI
ncbi:CLUMA_CG008494, isoform A, partial [Clunio marinus]